MSKQYNLTIEVEKPFGNLFRERHVLIAVMDKDGHILVGAKPDFLPIGITRLLGGGVKTEEPIESAIRELEEELNIQVKQKDLKQIFTVKLHAVDKAGHNYNTTTYVYVFYLNSDEYKAGDDVSEIVKLDLNDLLDLSNKYQSFDNNDWYKGIEGEHKWLDYGKLYAPIHKWVYDYLFAKHQ